jgi:hypothetical protein
MKWEVKFLDLDLNLNLYLNLGFRDLGRNE